MRSVLKKRKWNQSHTSNAVPRKSSINDKRNCFQ